MRDRTSYFNIKYKIEMSFARYLILFVFVHLFCVDGAQISRENDVVNEYPIVGILAQEMSKSLEAAYPTEYKSFIAASYVKFIEGGGARVVPVFINQTRSYYEDIMSKING